jgi:hypothetical protein
MKDEEMDEFERQLSRAMRRVEVRAETTAKFLSIAAAVKEEHERTGRRWIKPASGGRVLFMPRPRAWMGGAIAAVLVLGVLGGERVHQRRQQEMAERQFETAIRVTDHALEQTQAQLQRAGVKLGQ